MIKNQFVNNFITMTVQELYHKTLKKLRNFENNLENFTDICNPNASNKWDIQTNKKHPTEYRYIYQAQQQGAVNCYREILCFWDKDIKAIETAVNKLSLKFSNEWDIENAKSLSNLKPRRNIFSFEHDKEYVVQLMLYKRLIKAVKHHVEPKQGELFNEF